MNRNVYHATMTMSSANVMLIHAPYLDIYGALNIGDNFSFPLGIGYIAAVLRRAGHAVSIYEPRVRRICELLIEKKLDIMWYCFSRVDTIDEDLARLMQRAGCFSMLFGVESGNEDILRSVKKGISREKAREALRICNRLGYKTLASFILGLPGETRASIRETVDFAIELSPTIASFNRLIPFPGTEIYEEYYREKMRDISNWDAFIPQGEVPVIESNTLSKEELNRATARAFFRFYLRPSQIWCMLRSLSSWGEFTVYVRGALGIMRQSMRWARQFENKRQ